MKIPTTHLDAFNLPPAATVSIEKTYPPEIAEMRAYLLSEVEKHLTKAAEKARRAPEFAQKIAQTADRELSAARRELMRLEAFASVRMIAQNPRTNDAQEKKEQQ